MSEDIVFKFDDYALDTGNRELYFQNREVKIEPKVFDFILLLIEHHDQVLSKEQIARALWPQGDVSDAMLSRCVYRSRITLQQSKSCPAYIKTQYGRGFRFSGEFTVHHKVPDPEFYLGKLVSNAFFDSLSTERKPVTVTNTGIVRIGIGILQDEDAEDNLGLGKNLEEILIERLDGLEGFEPLKIQRNGKLADPDSYNPALTYYLSGSIIPDRREGVAFLRAKLIRLDDNQSIVLGHYDLSPLLIENVSSTKSAYFDAIINTIIDRTASCTGKNKAKIGSSSNTRAYCLYREANWMLSEQTEREGKVAQALLEEAVKLDPDFADAWTELGWAYYENMWAGGDGRIWVDLALKAVETAISREPNCTFAQSTKIIFKSEIGESESALTLAKKCIERDPECAAYWYAHSYVLRYLGFIDNSNQSLERCIALDPLFLTEIGDPATGLIYTGEWERFLQLTPAHDSPYFCYYRGYALWSMGETDKAIDELNQGVKDDPKDNFSRLSRALLLIIQEDLKGANAVLKKLARQRTMLLPGDSEFTYKEAKLLMLCENHSLALERLKASYESGFNVIPYCQRDHCFEPIRTSKKYLRLVNQANLTGLS